MIEENDPIAEGQRLQAAAVKAQEETDKIRPTPTQEEADRAKLGLIGNDGFSPPAYVEPELVEPIQSAPVQPVEPEPVEQSAATDEKSEEADKPARTYKTRAAKAD